MQEKKNPEGTLELSLKLFPSSYSDWVTRMRKYNAHKGNLPTTGLVLSGGGPHL